MNADEVQEGKRYRVTERWTEGAVGIYEDVVTVVTDASIHFRTLQPACRDVEVSSHLASVSIERIYEGLPDKPGTVVEDQDGLRWFLITTGTSSAPVWHSEFGTTTNNSSFQASARQAALAGHDWTVIAEGKS